MKINKSLGILALFPLSIFLACSSDSGGNIKQPEGGRENENISANSWSIKAYKISEMSKDVVNFSPKSQLKHFPGINTKSIKPLASSIEDGVASTIDAFDLLKFAGYECSIGMGRVGSLGLSPWAVESGTQYNTFMFPSPPNSCDDLLKMQEITLCIADHLAEIADTVRPVEWSVSGYVFPPQSEKDKFIVRDLAIYTLANLGVLDIFPNVTSISGRQCSSFYAKAGSDTAFANFEKFKIFGLESENSEGRYFSPLFSGIEVLAPELLAESARARLVHKTHVLRAGERLLKELVDKSVQADLAGAAFRRSKETDRVQGALLAWAGDRENSNSDDYYNSISHALRVVAGRWEMAPQGPLGGVGGPDPKCGGLGFDDTVLGYGESDLKARVFSEEVRTQAQEKAVNLLEANGIIAPSSALNSLEFSEIRQNIRKQILATSAHRIGYEIAPDFFSNSEYVKTGQGKILGDVYDQISDEDLAFAVRQNWNTYRLLTSVDGNATATSTQQDRAGLSKGDVPQFMGTAGVGLRDALPRTDLLLGALARAGGISKAAQCNELNGLSDARDASKTLRFAFQNAAAIAQTLQQGLVTVRESALEFHAEESVDLATTAVAEAEAWAGPGRVLGWSPSSGALPRRIDVDVVGFTPKDVGVSSVSAMPQEFALVWGAPWVAECAARVRKNCPENFETNYLAYPSNVSLATDLNTNNNTSLRRQYATDGALLRMSFRYADGWPSQFVPKFDGVGRTLPSNNEHLYVIQLHDPSASANVGRVLGALSIKKADGAFRLSSKVSTLPVSRFSSDITDRLLSIPQNWTGGSCQIGAPSPSSPDAYCVDRSVSRELFVPLENELTSDSDQYENSWKHYLQLARIAAERADQLGRELIDIGLQKDLRREAALEEAGKICGDFGSAQQATVINGEIQPSKPSGGDTPSGTSNTISNCIDSKKYDIVFATEDPYENLSAEEATQKIQTEVLRCPSGVDGGSLDHTPHMLCQRNGSNPISHAGLNLASAPSESLGVDCSPIPLTMQSLMQNIGLKPGFMQNFVKKFDQNSIAATLQGVRLKVRPDFSWSLVSSGLTVMDSLDMKGSEPANLNWPGCRRQGHTCPDSEQLLHKRYDVMFRSGSQELGYFEKSVDPGLSDEANEAGFIRRRVEAALWLMGSWGEYMPQGLFQTYIPAFNWGPGDISAALPTIYGLTPFQGNQLAAFDENGNAELDENIHTIGTTLPWAPWPGLRSISSSSSIENKYYLSYLPGYSDPNKLRYVKASSTGYSITHKEFLVSSLQKTINGFAGINCLDSNGIPTFLGALSEAPSSSEKQVKDWKFEGFRSASQPFESVTELIDGNNLNLYVIQEGVVSHREKGLGIFYLNNSQEFTLSFRNQLSPFLGAIVPNSIGNASIFLTNKSPLDLLPKAEVLGPFNSSSGFQMSVPQNACRFVDQKPFEAYSKNCIKNGEDNNYSLRFLWPSTWTPADRVALFVNSAKPEGVCAAATSTLQAAFLSCHLQSSQSGGLSPTERPVINSIEDLPLVARWLDGLRRSAEAQASSIYLENIPASVVAKFATKNVSPQENIGELGVLSAEMSASMEEIQGGWNSIATSISAIRGALASVNLQIAAANLNENSQLNSLTIQRLQSEMAFADTIAKNITACAVTIQAGTGAFVSWNAASCLAQTVYSGIAQSKIAKQQELLTQQEDIDKQSKSNQISMAINNMNGIFIDQNKAIEEATIRIRQAAFKVISLSNQYKSSELEASYAIGKAAGGDFVRTSDGQEVVYPVNTVLRRQYDITKRRYENALKEAKYMAFVARRAIEQRIGIRLATIDTPVGPFESPSQWADDVCNLQGIDYEQLRDKDFGIAGSSAFSGDNTAIDSFADRYVGDYVTKLENFVETYNITYPSHDGDDVAILSLRDDLLGSSSTCFKETPNLLYYSSRLDQRDAAVSENAGESRGWLVNHCNTTNTNCLTVAPKEAVPGAPDGPTESGNSTYSWIREVQPAASSDGGAGGASVESGFAGASGNPGQGTQGGTIQGTELGPLPQNVYQIVHLQPGNYVLSWWDQRRDDAGHCVSLPTTEPTTCTVLEETNASAPYAVSILDQGWTPINTNAADSGIFEPAIGGWSSRRTISFKILNEQDVSVSFSASLNGTTGSLLLAGIQLEKSASNSGSSGASPYIDTLGSRLYLSADCASVRTAEDVQKAFSYKCDAAGKCFYELTAPISINTDPIAQNKSRLNGKITAGNFNYRHLDLAVNLAGTGLINCENATGSSCYGSGYLEYTLAHDAFEAGILNYNGQQQCFSFGSASVNHAKALAAERYITNPVSSADQSLLSQPSVTKTELRGRPLDGTYRFRIWDHPGLQWNRLEDIQFVLRYRYWSPIQKSK